MEEDDTRTLEDDLTIDPVEPDGSVNRAPARLARRAPLALACLPLAALFAGCVADPAPPQGSWVELREAVLAEDALLIEDHPSFVSVRREYDRLRFTLRGESPLREGMVVAGNGDGFYLRRITRIEQSGDEIVAYTEFANIDDLYDRLHAVLHYRPVRSEGQPVTMYDGDLGMTRGSLADCNDRTPCTVTGDQQAGNETLGCSGGGSLSLGFQPYITTDLEADGEFDVDVGLFSGAKVTATVTVTGTVEAGVVISGSAAAELSCTADFAAALGGGEAPEITLWAFMIGPIPARLVARPVAEGTIEAAADVGSFTAQAGARIEATAELGMRDNELLDPRPEVTFDTFSDVSTSQAGGLSATGSLTLGAEIAIVAGGEINLPGPLPDVAVEAEAGLRLTGTLEAGFETDDRGCNWSGEVGWSLGATAFASFDFTIIEASAEFGPWTFASGTLAEFGGAFPWCGGSPGGECNAGERGSCMDDVFHVAVCDGQDGYLRCGDGMAQRCTCDGGAWVNCSPCLAVGP